MSDELRFALGSYRNSHLTGAGGGADDPLRFAQRSFAGGVTGGGWQPVQEPSPWSRVGSAVVNAGSLGLRTLAGVLEPIQLPKDVLDALLVGSLDDESTITERLNRIEWINYIPLGEVPNRPATGRELAEALGIKGNAAAATGFAWDILGDPLLVGGAISGLGKAARALGAADLGADLIRTGVAVDRAMSPAFMASKANEAFRLLPGVERMERWVGSSLAGALNARAFWQRGPEARTWGDLLLPQSVALERQLPRSVPGDVSGVSMGRRMFIGEGQGQQLGRDVEVQVMSILQDANNTVLGEAGLPWLRRVGRGLSRAIARTHDPEILRLPRILRDKIYREAFDITDEVGIGTRRSLSANAPAELSRTIEGVPLVTGTGARTSDQVQLLRESRKRIAEAARAEFSKPSYLKGISDPAQQQLHIQSRVNETLRRFDYFRDRVQEADALAGYYASGYEPILMRWLENLANFHISSKPITPAEGMRLWSEVRRQVMDGKTFKDIDRLTNPFTGELEDISTFMRGMKTPDGRQVRTVEDMVAGMGGEAGFYGLKLDAYMHNLQHGHMQRVYGMFQSAGDYGGFVAQLKAGKVIPGNILDAYQLPQLMGPQFQHEAQLLREYVAALELPHRTAGGPSATAAQPRGLLVRQEDLAQHLLDNGLTPGRVRETIGQLIKGLSGHQPMIKQIRQAKHILAEHEQTRGLVVAAGSGGTTVWGTRNRELEKQMLDTMGELASPIPAITAQAREVRQRLPWARYMSQTYDEGVAAGYVKTKQHYDALTDTDYVSMPNNPTIWGAFAGKWVHPFVRKELERILRARTENRGNAFGRLRSLITGGYLASPNVIAANMFGGVYTSAMAGISPDEFVPEMLRSWQQFQRASKDPAYVFQELDDLKRFIAVNRTTLVDSSVEKSLTALQGVVNAQDSNALRRTFNGVVQAIQGQLDAPLGQRWAGLDGFQFVENLMKVSAFTARRKRLAVERNVDLSEFAKPVAQRSEAALRIEAEAAETARVAVFDYSDLPESIRWLRDKGLMLFPGFQYFIIGRTLSAALNRPGALASADRISGAVADLAVDEDEKLALYGSLPEWLSEDQGVPLPFFSYTAEDGSRRHSVAPMNQLIPTNPFAGNPLIESLAFGGIFRPLVEVLSANVLEDDGQAPFSGKYGQRVYSRGATRAERLVQSTGYLINSLMPGILRKTVGTYHPDEGVRGGLLSSPASAAAINQAAKAVGLNGVPIPEELSGTLYSYQEIQTRRADKRFGDLMLSMFLRSPQVITTGGGLTATVFSVVRQSREDMLDEVARLRAMAQRALRNGNREVALEYYRQIGQRQRLWAEEIMPRYQAALR